MKIQSPFVTSFIVGLSFVASASAQEVQGEVKGRIEVTYDNLVPAYFDGGHCRDMACQAFAETCEQVYGFMRGSTATVDYNILTDKKIQKATYTYTTFSKEPVTMSALGIDKQFGFISKSVPTDLRNGLGIKNIFFVIDGGLKTFSSHFIFNLSDKIQDQSYQCILSGKGSL